MLDLLPIEVLHVIVDNYDYSNDPLSYYGLRYVNKAFNEIIMSKKNLYPLNYEYNKYSLTHKKINELCCTKTSVTTFQWLMKNNIFFSLCHIRNLIMKNRIDVLRAGTKYSGFLEVLFNRFHIHDFNDLFTYSDSTSPLIIAGTYNKLEIIKLLLEAGTYGNPYLKGIGALFELSVKHSHKNLLSYLVEDHYPIIKDKLNIKINTIIQRFDDVEDILYHLALSNKIKISHKFLGGLITKGKYNDIFIFCFLKGNLEMIDLINLLVQTISYNNYEIFNFLLSENRIKLNNDRLSYLLMKNMEHLGHIKKEFIYNLFNNHMNQLNKDVPLIRIGIENDIDEKTIEQLVINGFYYSYEEMKNVLENKNMKMLKILVGHYKE
jgi:hypothetical protein